jgi:tetratricopeptide (TPR) repeat protein
MGAGGELAWAFQIGKALDRGSFEEAVTLCKNAPKRQDSANLRFTLARIYHYQNKPAEAERHLRSGLKCDQSSIHCCLGLAVLLLQRSTPKALKEAAEQLNVAQKLLSRTPDRELQNDYDSIRAMVAALDGDVAGARTLLQKVVDSDESHTSARNALKLLSR